MLELKDIYHYYGSAKVLEEFNLKIEEKSLNALIGPNGIGKSTVLRLISGLEKPNRGRIEFLGERIDGLKAHKIAKKGISQSPDRRRLFYDLNVADNIRMGAYLLKDKQEYEKLIDSVYKRRGWDDNGVPTMETIKRLGLDIPEIVNVIKLD